MRSLFASFAVGAAATETGQWMYQKYSDGNCTIPADNHHAGPLNTCMDMSKGVGFTAPGPAAIVTKVNNTATITWYAEHGCTGSPGVAAPMAVDTCSASGTGGYYLLYYHDSTFEGYHQYRKYTDSSCTAPMNSSTTGYSYWEGLENHCTDTNQYGAGVSLRYLNQTGCGTGTISTHWGTACGSSLATVPMAEDTCGASGTGGYYYATCNTPEEVASYAVGSWMYQKFSDENCTVLSSTHMAGPLSTCVDMTKGSGMDGAGPAGIVTLQESTAKISWYASHGCEGTPTVGNIPMSVGVCTSSLTGGYYILYHTTDAFQDIIGTASTPTALALRRMK
jgi:hypothetical protein